LWSDFKTKKEQLASIKRSEGCALDKGSIKHKGRLQGDLTRVQSSNSLKMTIALAQAQLRKEKQDIRVQDVKKELGLTHGTKTIPP